MTKYTHVLMIGLKTFLCLKHVRSFIHGAFIQHTRWLAMRQLTNKFESIARKEIILNVLLQTIEISKTLVFRNSFHL
jgi:hypothetical protein